MEPAARCGELRNRDTRRDSGRERTMAEHVVPHFHNDIGAAVIEIGAKEFMCIGAMPPFDHPHVFCDMGDDNEFICSYCSTLYRYDPKLHGYEARPRECAWQVPETA